MSRCGFRSAIAISGDRRRKQRPWRFHSGPGMRYLTRRGTSRQKSPLTQVLLPSRTSVLPNLPPQSGRPSEGRVRSPLWVMGSEPRSGRASAAKRGFAVGCGATASRRRPPPGSTNARQLRRNMTANFRFRRPPPLLASAASHDCGRNSFQGLGARRSEAQERLHATSAIRRSLRPAAAVVSSAPCPGP